MSKKTTLFTIVVAALLLTVVVAIAVNAPSKKTDTSNSTASQPSSTNETTQSTDKVAATITYTDSGFEPAAVTVKSGDTVRIENKSSNSLSFNSGDHPTHLKNSELNVGDVPQGESKDFKVTKTGVWSFHNHNNSGDTGTLTVE